MLGLAASAALGVGLVYLAAVRTGEGRRLDDAAKGALEEGSRAFDETSQLLDTISISSLALLGVAIMAIALLRGRPRLALGAGVIVLGANLTTQALKATLSGPSSGLPEAGTYPSGHVTVAMSLAMALVLVAPPALRLTATVFGGAYAIGVGVAVMALNWHRPSDVIGAYLVAVAWTALVGAALASTPGAGELRRPERPPSRAAQVVAAATIVLAVGFVAVTVISGTSHRDLVRLVDDRTAFAAAAAVCALAGAALAAVVAALLQRASRGGAATR
jgi:membrane-associated phospholipid phosphatase